MIPTYRFHDEYCHSFPTSDRYKNISQDESNIDYHKLFRMYKNDFTYESNNVNKLIHLKNIIIDNINKKDCDIYEKILLIKDFLLVYSKTPYRIPIISSKI